MPGPYSERYIERQWTPCELGLFLECNYRKMRRSHIAKVFVISYPSVERMFRRLSRAGEVERHMENHVSKLTATNRTCMTCGIHFISEGNHNRLCDDCRRKPTG